MAWENRQRGSLYYTRSRREGGRVVREYVGCGPQGLAAAEDARIREEREAKRGAWRAEQQRLEILDQHVEPLDALCTTITRGCLEAAGYHQHKAGEWRKRRGLRAGSKQ